MEWFEKKHVCLVAGLLRRGACLCATLWPSFSSFGVLMIRNGGSGFGTAPVERFGSSHAGPMTRRSARRAASPRNTPGGCPATPAWKSRSFAPNTQCAGLNLYFVVEVRADMNDKTKSKSSAICRRLFRTGVQLATSAQRMNVESRGCQPTEQRLQHLRYPERVERCFAPSTPVRPRQGRVHLRRSSVGCTHGYPRCSASPTPTSARPSSQPRRSFSGFGFRVSDFFRISDFGFRIFHFASR